MGINSESDGIYILEIYHQSGKISEQRYENKNLAFYEFERQCKYYGKRKLKLYTLASYYYTSGTLLASHNFPD